MRLCLQLGYRCRACGALSDDQQREEWRVAVALFGATEEVCRKCNAPPEYQEADLVDEDDEEEEDASREAE